MAFKNEKISEQDREWVSKLVNYDSIRAISRWVHRFRIPCRWTVDRELDTYLIHLGGGGSPDDEGRMPYAVLIFNGQAVVFNFVRRGTGDGNVGIHRTMEIYNLILPPALAPKKEEIKMILKKGLEEDAYCNPFEDGGTVANPNMVARKNIKSFKIEFK